MSLLRKPIFFSSDHHIGHEKSIEFDNRPFSSLVEMHESLVAKYNATVPDNGICYFLGDIGFKTAEVLPIINRLNGTKIFILGNHDRGMTSMYNCGFDVVLNNATIYVGDNKVTMSHCPLLGVYREDTSNMKGSVSGENWHGESRDSHKKFTVLDEGQFHLHGHIHSGKNDSISKRILGRQFDVGVVANNYRPVSLSEIEGWIVKTLKEESVI